MVKIPLEDAVELLEMEGYDVPEIVKEINLEDMDVEVPEEFTINELEEAVRKAVLPDIEIGTMYYTIEKGRRRRWGKPVRMVEDKVVIYNPNAPKEYRYYELEKEDMQKWIAKKLIWTKPKVNKKYTENVVSIFEEESTTSESEKKKPCRERTYLTIKPEALASTINAERVVEWLNRKGYRDIVIEHPNLLSEKDRKELEDILGEEIYTYKTVYDCD